MRTLRKSKLIVAMLIVALMSFAMGITTTFKAQAEVTAYTVEQVTDATNGSFKMANGASVRNSGDASTSGLRYALTLSEDHYNGLKESVRLGTYDSVEFGIFILPSAYNEIFAVRDYAFGDEVKYNWAVKNDLGEWEYTAESGKERIINLTGNAMTYNEELGVMAFYGTMTKVLTENLGRDMLGVGYMAYTVDGKTEYLFTSAEQEVNNTRNMTYVALQAIEKGEENTSWLTSAYVTPVKETGTEFTYLTEYYFQQPDGTYAKNDNKTTALKGTLDKKVKAELIDVDGYEFDEINKSNKLINYIGAYNSQVLFKCYYKQSAILVEVNETPIIDFETLSGKSNVTATLTTKAGVVTEIEDVNNFSTTSVKQGVYTVTLKQGDNVVYVRDIDIYDELDGLVYQVIDENSVKDAEILRGGYLKLATPVYTTISGKSVLSWDMVKGDNSTTEVGMRLRALHSKEYYKMMSENYTAITFDIYNAGNDGINIEIFDDADNDGVNDDLDGVWQGKNTWKTYSVPLNYLIDNYATLNAVSVLDFGSVMTSQLYTTYYGYVDSNVISVANFGAVAKEVDAVEVSDVQLIETGANPTYNFLSLDSESKLDSSLNYKAVLKHANGRVVKILDAKNVDTTTIPQGVYSLEVKLAGITYLTATVDIYTATDGMIWQEISEYSVNDSHVWKYTYNNVGSATFEALTKDSQNVNVLSFVTVKAGEGNTNEVGLRIKAIHSKEYYEMMSETYEEITFDVYRTGGGDLNVCAGNLERTSSAWHGNNAWKTYSLSIDWILTNWDSVNDLTTKDLSNTLFVKTWYGTDGTTKVSVGNFGSKQKEIENVEVTGVNLVETGATPTYNFLSLDSESKLDSSLDYTAVLTHANGRVVEISDAKTVDTTTIPQGVYSLEVKIAGITCLTATVDFYTAADGMVWQEVSEYTVNDSRVWKAGYTNIGETTVVDVSGIMRVQTSAATKGTDNNTANFGMRLRAIHSKEYYQMMSETYSAITYTAYVNRVSGSGNGCSVKSPDGSFGWVNHGKTKDLSISIDYILENWDSLNNLSDKADSSEVSLFIITKDAVLDQTIIQLGNFGSTLKSTEA